ncbi:protein-export membrane protein SecD [Thermincola ferriacetica]|uniref:Protein translocase subunit SecD n=1 Tax=Thermincola ferriacetica TaxID=281456 RepID=A0A0L6W6D8_9FIRM|nr:protein translocase subunit SecD [Thermincola ferriacetica]KNZ71085.1 protein-export membrane protein SecD [Thermincola ferriacetica]
MRTKSLISLLLTIALIAVSGYLLIHFKVFQKHINLGLDLQGGLHVVMEAVDTPEAPVTDDSLDRVKAVIERRVNETGVKEPIIQREGKRRLIVELAGIKNPDAAIDLIGKTAVLQFKTSDGKVVVSGSDLKDAQAAKNPTTGEIYVALEFNKEGTKKFADVTSELVQKYSESDPRRRIGIYLDQQQLQNPVVREPIPNGRAQINGYNTLEEAAKMAVLLRSGALPVKMEKVYTQTVGPTLGADSLAKSTKAGIVGIIAILIFMIAYYRIPGLIANVALAAYALIVLGLFAALQATLTLPGIAGFLLSIGMAVDANIIIFERVKEELREGNSLRRSIESGFSRAFWTVFDSNVTTLIAAAILYYFGTGAIRGFAITLSIGILASMFTAITLTRFMLRNLADSKLITNKKLYGA